MNGTTAARGVEDLVGARGAVTAALEAGDVAGARRLVEEALQHWPRDVGLRMREAEVLHRLDEPEAAIERYLGLGRENPETHWALLRAVRLLRDVGDLAQAREVFAAEFWTGPAPDDVKLRGLAWIVTAADESEQAAAFLDRLAAAPPPAPTAEALTKLAELRARQGREDEARSALARFGSPDAAPLRARAVEADLLLAEGRMSELLPLARALAAEEPDRIEHARRLVGALALSGDAETADTLSAALERWPGDWILLSRFANLPAPRERIARVIGSVMGRTDVAALPEISRFWIALILLSLRRTEEALGLLAGIVPDGATGTMSDPLRRALDIMPAEEWHRRSRLDDDRAAEVQVVRSPGARTALLVFGAPTGGFSYLPFGHFDALLADLPAHVVYVRDTSGSGFLRGLASFGGTAEGAVAGLKSLLLAGLGAERIVTMGASIAGQAAARLGAALGAESVALLSTPTTLEGASTGSEGERPSPYNRLNRMRRLAKVYAPDTSETDLVAFFESATRIRGYYCYGAGTERGERHAERLRGLPNVVLRPLPDSTANAVPLNILRSPSWRPLLEDDLGLGR